MIGFEDVYKVVAAMAPLYFAMFLGFSSIRWFHIFKPDHCDGINRFNYYYIFPFLNFHLVSSVNPYTMNYHFVASDVAAKALIFLVLVAWANCTRKGGLDWAITTFSLSALNNSVIVGVPLLQAMYGELGFDIVIQSAVIQTALWLTLLMLALEFRCTRLTQSLSSGDGNEDSKHSTVCSIEIGDGSDKNTMTVSAPSKSKPPFWKLMRAVAVKLAKNPNTYAWFLGLVWALIANRWNFEMPSILNRSIMIMGAAGSGISMFCSGIFMALQSKIISCGATMTVYGLVLRFAVGPATSALGALLLRLHGDVLKIVIVQAALPQAVAAFVYANEYGVHAEVLSTAVIIGTIISLPILIGYYFALNLLH